MHLLLLFFFSSIKKMMMRLLLDVSIILTLSCTVAIISSSCNASRVNVLLYTLYPFIWLSSLIHPPDYTADGTVEDQTTLLDSVNAWLQRRMLCSLSTGR